MNNLTTPAAYSQRLQQIQNQFDAIIKNSPNIETLPALYNYDYDYYLQAVCKSDPLHMGPIYYKGREVRRMGR